MRIVKPLQMEFEQIDIADIEFDLKSRDELPQLLKGLQHLYVNSSIREKVFALLEKHISPNVDKKNGRPGMNLWSILVLGVLRLDLNWNFDRLQDEANNHLKIREMLGHSGWSNPHYYHLQTLKDNVSLLTPELLDELNQIVVQEGHHLMGKKKEKEMLRGRCDSFVVKTNVHYPTDINLLFDAMRKIIIIVSRLCEKNSKTDFRQSAYNIKSLKKLLRKAQKSKRLGSGNEERKAYREKMIQETHLEYILASKKYLSKAHAIFQDFLIHENATMFDEIAFENFFNHAIRQISQIERRVLLGEEIPHKEKVFSLFQPHTEWISKGKAGVPVELGVRVCVMEDQHQFLLYHRVMFKETDDQVAIKMVEETIKRFPKLTLCSFDKGFHSPNNQNELREKLDFLAMPRKGKLSRQAKEHESSQQFAKARKKHPAVESAINALEVHGLDRCPDNGKDGFLRYVALAIVARNIQHMGAILQKREQKREARRNVHDGTLKLAA